MLKLNLRFSGLGLTKRDDNLYVLRNLESFPDLEANLVNKPLLLQHPTDDMNNKVLLSSDSNYDIIGFIESIASITEDEIRVNCIVNDPILIEYYNALSDEEKIDFISSSPGVSSIYEDEIDYLNNIKIVHEMVEEIDHLSVILKMSNECGYWDQYTKTPALDINNNETLQHTINNINYGDNSMAEFVEKSTGEVAELKDSEVQAEEVKDSEVDKRELIRKEMAIAAKPADEFEGGDKEKVETIAKLAEEEAYNKSEADHNDSEEIKEEVKVDSEEAEEKQEEIKDSDVEEKVEELIKHEESESEMFEELAEDHKNLDDEIVEEYVTPEDEEREVIVKLMQNLVDSIEGIRKPYFKGRVKAETYLRKALSLNKDFIDSKYHTSLDSVSVDLGKEILDSISVKSTEVKSKEVDIYAPKQIAPGVTERVIKF